MEKLVSVIMSTKDTEENMLRASIDSILCQSYSNFEFLIVCDGSENDYKILKSYDDSRIIIIKHDKSKGLTKSLNEALLIAKGDYIARMDSDDYSLKDRLKIQVEYMEKNPNIDISSTMVKHFGNSSELKVNHYDDSDGIKVQLFLYNCLAHPAIIMRKSFIDKNNILYDESFKYSQDYDLWSRSCFIGNLSVINKLCLFYRMHNNQISTAKLDEQNQLCERIYLRNLEKLEVANAKEKVKLLFEITGRIPSESNINEMYAFIEELIERNTETKVYDEKKFSKILYFSLFSYYLKTQHKLISLKFILKNGITCMVFKRITLKIYYTIRYSVRILKFKSSMG